MISETNSLQINFSGIQDISWRELELEKHKIKELQRYSSVLKNIRQDFHNIREKLQTCLNANALEPPDAKLPIEIFNIDVDGTEALIEMTRKKCQIEHEELLEFCREQEKIISWIKTNTWDLMEVKSTKLRGIFSNICIENYPLRFNNGIGDLLEKIIFERKKECSVSSIDIFLPWIPKTTAGLERELASTPNVIGKFSEMMEAGRRKSLNTKLNEFSHSGTSTHMYIKPFEWRYKQLEVVSFHQMHAECAMTDVRI